MSKELRKGDFVKIGKCDFSMSPRLKRITGHCGHLYDLVDNSGRPVNSRDGSEIEVVISQDGILELLHRLEETLNAIFKANDFYIASELDGNLYRILLVDRLSDLCVELTRGYYEDDEMEDAIRTFEREKEEKK